LTHLSPLEAQEIVKATLKEITTNAYPSLLTLTIALCTDSFDVGDAFKAAVRAALDFRIHWLLENRTKHKLPFDIRVLDRRDPALTLSITDTVQLDVNRDRQRGFQLVGAQIYLADWVKHVATYIISVSIKDVYVYPEDVEPLLGMHNMRILKINNVHFSPILGARNSKWGDLWEGGSVNWNALIDLSVKDTFYCVAPGANPAPSKDDHEKLQALQYTVAARAMQQGILVKYG
jgi:hypothetical protein